MPKTPPNTGQCGGECVVCFLFTNHIQWWSLSGYCRCDNCHRIYLACSERRNPLSLMPHELFPSSDTLKTKHNFSFSVSVNLYLCISNTLLAPWRWTIGVRWVGLRPGQDSIALALGICWVQNLHPAAWSWYQRQRSSINTDTPEQPASCWEKGRFCGLFILYPEAMIP